MIAMFEWIVHNFGTIFDKWMAFIEPVCNANWVVTSIVVWSFIFLFLMLRNDYKKYGDAAFELEGPELVIAALAGAIMTGCLYMLPVLVVAVVSTFGLALLLCALRVLVVISVEGVNRE